MLAVPGPSHLVLSIRLSSITDCINESGYRLFSLICLLLHPSLTGSKTYHTDDRVIEGMLPSLLQVRV